MKLTISPDQELGDHVFTSGDVLTGLVYLDVNDTLAISGIVFSIKGKCAKAIIKSLSKA